MPTSTTADSRKTELVHYLQTLSFSSPVQRKIEKLDKWTSLSDASICPCFILEKYIKPHHKETKPLCTTSGSETNIYILFSINNQRSWGERHHRLAKCFCNAVKRQFI